MIGKLERRLLRITKHVRESTKKIKRIHEKASKAVGRNGAEGGKGEARPQANLRLAVFKEGGESSILVVGTRNDDLKFQIQMELNHKNITFLYNTFQVYKLHKCFLERKTNQK